MQALLRYIEPYLDILRTLCNPCMYKHAIFRTLAYLEPEASATCILNKSSEACQTCKMIRHIQRPCIVRKVYSNIFEDLLGYSGILLGIQPHSGIILFAKRCILNVWQCSEYASSSITTKKFVQWPYAMFCIRLIQNSGIFRTLFIQIYSCIFKDIKYY